MVFTEFELVWVMETKRYMGKLNNQLEVRRDVFMGNDYLESQKHFYYKNNTEFSRK